MILVDRHFLLMFVMKLGLLLMFYFMKPPERENPRF
jgi:hypothetical protein